MKRLALSLLVVACMFCCTACRHVDENHLEIYSSDRTEQVLSTTDSDLQVRFMALVNEYEAFDGDVDADHPDYIISVGPVDAKNGVAEYRVWMVEGKLVFETPAFPDIPSQMIVSKHPAEEFTALWESKRQ
ncbi:hypothetical protein [Anaeromassilibacillus senegalensis]|uniref:hypothetical protein n=1 Tax=Anaeromassilibacillus senegalensis TaxID=1673717 RepID=UPI00068218AE|nr:hypothetical protein [Anaeromassilibacillus senegalensis]